MYSGFDILPARAGLDLSAIASSDASARDVGRRLYEDFESGRRDGVFAVLREYAAVVRTPGAAPALDELVEKVCQLTKIAPWLAADGDPYLRECAHLLCVEAFECAHILEDGGGGMHLLEGGELLARTLQNSDAFTVCGLPVREMTRPPRGAWNERGFARCPSCRDREERRPADERLLDERDLAPAHPLPLLGGELLLLHRRFAANLAGRVRAHPERARTHFERWVTAAYVPELRRALGATARSCMWTAEDPQQCGRFRWALGGLYSAAEPSRCRLIDNQLDVLIECLSVRNWQAATPTPRQLADGSAAAHLSARLTRRLFGGTAR